MVVGLALGLFVLWTAWMRYMYLRMKTRAFISTLKAKGCYGAKLDKALDEFWATWPREPVAWYVKRARGKRG